MSFVKIFTSSAVYDHAADGIDFGDDLIRSRDRVRDQEEVFTQPRPDLVNEKKKTAKQRGRPRR